MFTHGVQLDWSFDPLEALARWPARRKVVLLHSGRFDARWARWSILAEPVGAFRFGADGRSRWVGPPLPGGQPLHLCHKPFADLRRVLRRAAGPLIGFLSYDLGRWIERLPLRCADDRGWDVIDLAWCPRFLVYDGLKRRWLACGCWQDQDVPDLARARPEPLPWRASGMASVFSRRRYESSVRQVLGYIGAGDVFQVNLAQRFTADLTGPRPQAHRSLFRRLATVGRPWYGAYMETLDEPHRQLTGRIIASASPELFCQLDGDRVISRPIKGTRPASVDPDLLRRSAKDAAELHMIVDLVRNDLGRVCAYGSVRVAERRQIETHPTVHHGVATIRGRLHGTKDVVDLLRATMPGGSVTGAPKVRAMQIIEELEPVRRGPYCGSIGYLAPQAACLNIAIRTMLIDPDRHLVDFSVGGGIVADSDPAAEFQETLDKAAAIRKALLPDRRRPAEPEPLTANVPAD